MLLVATLAAAMIQAYGGADVGGGASPAVVAADPAPHDRGVRLSRAITATFSKDLHPLSIERVASG